MRGLIFLWLLSPALAAPTWSVLPFEARGVDGAAVETFRDLLVSELGSRNQAQFVDGDGPCSDVPCARKAGGRLGAEVVVYGKVAALGRNIIITAAAVNVSQNRVLSQQRMSVDRIEDLEPAAARMASAILSGKQVDETAELGNVTQKEVPPDLRREGHRGPSLRLGGAGLVDQPDLGGAAVRFDLGYWYEARSFAIEPFVGGRFSTDEPGNSFGINLDVGAYYIPGRGDATPFIGGGGGLRLVGGTRTERVSVGQIVPLETSTEKSEEAWGPGAFGRVGILFFRTYSMRMAVSADFDVAFVDIFGDGPVKAVQGGIAVMF